ncbi:unnamed protein product, partial [Heterosigma akashiwo]
SASSDNSFSDGGSTPSLKNASHFDLQLQKMALERARQRSHKTAIEAIQKRMKDR